MFAKNVNPNAVEWRKMFFCTVQVASGKLSDSSHVASPYISTRYHDSLVADLITSHLVHDMCIIGPRVSSIRSVKFPKIIWYLIRTNEELIYTYIILLNCWLSDSIRNLIKQLYSVNRAAGRVCWLSTSQTCWDTIWNLLCCTRLVFCVRRKRI